MHKKMEDYVLAMVKDIRFATGFKMDLVWIACLGVWCAPVIGAHAINAHGA